MDTEYGEREYHEKRYRCDCLLLIEGVGFKRNGAVVVGKELWDT
jgi:hypothetical protein